MVDYQPRLEEPVLITDPPTLGAGIRVGSLVIFKGRTRSVIEITTKPISTPGIPCFEEDAIDECPSVPFNKVGIKVRIPEGFVLLKDVKVVRL
jgi:hypothetical protein